MEHPIKRLLLFININELISSLLIWLDSPNLSGILLTTNKTSLVGYF